MKDLIFTLNKKTMVSVNDIIIIIIIIIINNLKRRVIFATHKNTGAYKKNLKTVPVCYRNMCRIIHVVTVPWQATVTVGTQHACKEAWGKGGGGCGMGV
jgi:hypothetical protein